MRICVDFDGTIYDWGNGTLIDGAKEGLKKLKGNGIEINIFSCRTSHEFRSYPIDRKQEIIFMESFLNENDVPFDRILDVDKPVADLYLDDRGIGVNNNWEEVVDNIINKKQDLDNGEIKDNIQHFELVAVIDGYGENKIIHLYLEYDGDIMQELRWPDDWPEKVSSSFLRQKGFRVETA